MGENAMITFDWWIAFLFLPLPLLVRWFVPKAASVEQAALRVPFFNNVRELGTDISSRSQRRGSFKHIPRLIWPLLILALAQPHYLGAPIQIANEGRDLMLAVDLSRSMEIQDLMVGGQPANRLDAVKSAMLPFIERRQGDRIGLILFGDQAYLQTPLTYDSKTVAQFLDEAVIGIAGRSTAIGDAIGLAIKRLKDLPSDSKVLILLTDGQNTAGQLDPIQAAQLAAQQKLTIYTIGVGADEMYQPGLFGSRFGSRTINPSRDLDEKSLIKIAELTGGKYFRARNTDELEKIYTLIDDLEPVESDSLTYRPKQSLYFYPLGLALLLSVLLALRKLAPEWKQKLNSSISNNSHERTL